MGYVSSAMYDSKLPGLLRRLRADWPGIELSLVQGGCANALRSAVGSASGYRHHPRAAGLGRRTRWWSGRFVREKLCLALYQQHPLAGVGALNLASLRTDNWISLDDPQGTGLEQVFMDACRVAGFTPQVAQRINDVTSMISLVSAGVGVALVPLSGAGLTP
ncbi:LysR family transcriptional regulator [Klebsiella pneumoniae]|nr:LysR family transcriptional regulator [Klebsiella pneumoniae]